VAKKQPFALIYDGEVAGHLDAIEPKYHALIRSAIEEQLQFQLETATRNRKEDGARLLVCSYPSDLAGR
jgi:hypothetical protein